MGLDRRELLNDSEEAMRLTLDGRQSGMWTAIPCIVQSVNMAEMTCECQPAIQGSVTDENNVTTLVNLPLLVDVPIVFPSAGGFTITMPLAQGDEVLVLFSSRCIDDWWQSGGIGIPIEQRMHDLSDGFAIPGPKSKPKVISGISTTSLQIRNNAGDTFMEITNDGKIKFSAGSDIELTGALKVTGDLNVTGKISATQDVIGNSGTTPISLTMHTHTSAAPGSPTGPPLP